MSTALPLGEAKAKLFKRVTRVTGQHERTTITVHGRSSAVLMSVEDLKSIEETIEILSETARRRKNDRRQLSRTVRRALPAALPRISGVVGYGRYLLSAANGLTW